MNNCQFSHRSLERRYGTGHSILAPNLSDHTLKTLPQFLANSPSFSSVSGEDAVEQDGTGGHLPDMAALGFERALGRSDEEAQNKRIDGGNEPRAQPNDLLRVIGDGEQASLRGSIPAKTPDTTAAKTTHDSVNGLNACSPNTLSNSLAEDRITAAVSDARRHKVDMKHDKAVFVSHWLMRPIPPGRRPTKPEA